MLDFSPFLKTGVTLPTFILSGKIPVFSDKLNYSLEGFSVHCKNFLWHLHVYYHSQGLLKKTISNSSSFSKNASDIWKIWFKIGCAM